MLHNLTFLYSVQAVGKTKILAPLIFFKWNFLKRNLFNKWNQDNICILHNGTLLYIAHAIGKS